MFATVSPTWIYMYMFRVGLIRFVFLAWIWFFLLIFENKLHVLHTHFLHLQNKLIHMLSVCFVVLFLVQRGLLPWKKISYLNQSLFLSEPLPTLHWIYFVFLFFIYFSFFFFLFGLTSELPLVISFDETWMLVEHIEITI